ncbi:MAG: N-acetylmuramoyl-L-alanine amidase, partial [bacterium]
RWRRSGGAGARGVAAVARRGVGEGERSGLGPAAVRERMPLALLGVQAPGVLIECGSLTEPEERARLTSPAGMRALAQAIAEGVLVWQRPE